MKDEEASHLLRREIWMVQTIEDPLTIKVGRRSSTPRVLYKCYCF